jgi:hypothetical protein
MSVQSRHPQARIELVRWTARLGAVTAESLARYGQASVASARARLSAAERAGLLASSRPLSQAPALFLVTPAGMRAAGLRGFEPTRVTPANARHAVACAAAAAVLARAYPTQLVSGERELRRDEHAFGGALASAQLNVRGRGAQLHRPDLVLWPADARQLPVAVEVELTVKAPRRLLEICTAWARCRCVSGVLYLAAREAHRPLERAIGRAQAGGRITLVALGELLGARGLREPPFEDPVAGDA